MTKVFLDYDQKALDDQYEQRVWVPHADEIIKRYSAASDRCQEKIGEPRVERYGADPSPRRSTSTAAGRKRSSSCTAAPGSASRAASRRFPPSAIIEAGAAYVALNFANLPA